jgi:preprotein translocase subunit SecG
MMILVTVLHVLACVTLVLVVLLQAGKGADMGAVFGGSSTTIFGSSGAGNFLTRLTTGAAIVFMITSLTLTYGSTRSTSSTIMPESVAPPVEEGGAGLDPTNPADVGAVEDAVDPGGARDSAGIIGDAADVPPAGGQPEAAAPAGEAAPAAPVERPAEEAPAVP